MSIPPPPAIEIDCQIVKQWIDAGAPFLLLDCREQDERDLVRIDAPLAQSAFIPMGEVTERTAELEPHRETDIVVFCHHGARSLRVAAWLRRQGFARARSMAGGIDRWALEMDRSLARY